MALPTFNAGNKLRASELRAIVDAMNAATVRNADATTRTTTSTGYTTALTPANICGVSFTAPQSGKVRITWSASLSNSNPPNIAQCSPGIRTGATVGSGTVVQAAGGNVHITATTNMRAGASTEVTGLTPGTVYNVALEQRAFSAGTATFDSREVSVAPLLN